MNNTIKRTWNQGSMVNIEDLRGMTFQAESGGHTFVISAVDADGNAVSLSGTPAGTMLRPDNTDQALTCSISGGKVYATLPAGCYDVPGRAGITIFLTSNGQKVAIYAAVVSISRTQSGTVAPGTTASVVDLINAINAAIAGIPATDTALKAAMAPTYSTSGLYAVGAYSWYNGTLYRCTTPITSGETWNSAHWVAAALGNDVSDLKSAFSKMTDGVSYDLIGAVTPNIKTETISTSLFTYYSPPTLLKDRKYFVSAKLNSSVAGKWRLAAIKPNGTGYVISNILEKTVQADTDTIFNAIFTPTQDFCVCFINVTGSTATVTVETYCYDITGTSVDISDVWQGLVNRGFAKDALSDVQTQKAIYGIQEALENSLIFNLFATNTKTGSVNYSNYVAIDTTLEQGKTYFISSKINSSNAGTWELAALNLNGATYVRRHIKDIIVQANTDIVLNAIYKGTENFLFAFLNMTGASANYTIEAYCYDITSLGEDFNVGNELISYPIAKHAINAETAGISNISNKTNCVEVGESKYHIISAPTWYTSIGFYDWSTEKTHLYILNNKTGLNANAQIGWLNSGGSWVGGLNANNSVTVDGSTYYYVAGEAPSTAVADQSVRLVMNNSANVDVTILICDVTGITLTADIVKKIIQYSDSGITGLDIIDGLQSEDQSLLGNSWKGKSVLFIGDSLTEANQYQQTVVSNLGITYTNHAKGGLGITAIINGSGSFPALSVADVTGKDLIVLYAGYNNRGSSAGQAGDIYPTNSTIAGYMQYAINKIYELLATANNLTCHIMIVTVDCAGKYPWIDADGYTEYPSGSGQSMETIANVQKAVADYNSLPCVDLWHNSGINRNTWTVFGRQPDAYIDDPTEPEAPYPHNGDQLHKSPAGYKRIGECITGGILDAYGN